MIFVTAGTAIQGVIAGTTVQTVITSLAVQRIVTGTAVQHIVCGIAIQAIVTIGTLHHHDFDLINIPDGAIGKEDLFQLISTVTIAIKVAIHRNAVGAAQ